MYKMSLENFVISENKEAVKDQRHISTELRSQLEEAPTGQREVIMILKIIIKLQWSLWRMVVISQHQNYSENFRQHLSSISFLNLSVE